jgi:hypothetical protein
VDPIPDSLLLRKKKLVVPGIEPGPLKTVTVTEKCILVTVFGHMVVLQNTVQI